MTRPAYSFAADRADAIDRARRQGQQDERRRCRDIALAVAARYLAGDGYAAAREIARRIAEGNES